MKLDDLIQIAKEGNLTLDKHPRYEATRAKYIWHDEIPFKIVRTEYIKYMLYMHMAIVGGHRYKINKKDYATLLKILESDNKK